MVLAGAAAVSLLAAGVLLAVHGRALIAALLAFAAVWTVAGVVSELRAPRCPRCRETFCRRCVAVGPSVPPRAR